MNANVFIPLISPTAIQMINIIPDTVRIDERRATKRKCDHPGVVGENDS